MKVAAWLWLVVMVATSWEQPKSLTRVGEWCREQIMGINIGDIQQLQREAGQAEDDQTQTTQSNVDPSGILTEAQEPSKILPDEKLPIAENEAPKEDEQVSGQASKPAQEAPLTKEMFAAQMKKLTERARAAGLNPIQVMAQTYARQGMVILEGILAALENEKSENESSSKKRKG